MTIPKGFVSRAAATKKFNRSQRALERDLDVAITTADLDELAHWKLVTKDDQVFDASEVTTEQVKELVATGMVPVWCVEKEWLGEKYGERGSSPRRVQQTTPVAEPVVPASNESTKSTNPGNPTDQSFPSSPDDVDFLKQRIQILEREKQQEQTRHDRVVEKLFEQLDVKDKQISAWDEVTQGLTKGLATGQLRVDRNAQLPGVQPDATERRDVRDVEVSPAADDSSAGKSSTRKERPPAKPSANAKAKKRSKRVTAAKKKPSIWQTEINIFPFRRK